MKTWTDFSSILGGAPSDPLYSSDEAAAYLGLAPNTLAVWRSNGRHDIPYIKVGRLVKYRKSALDAFLERRTRGAFVEQTINSKSPLPDLGRQKPVFPDLKRACGNQAHSATSGAAANPATAPPAAQERDTNCKHEHQEIQRYRRKK